MRKKYYNVTVYETTKEHERQRIGKIIVEKNLLGVQEIVSGIEMDRVLTNGPICLFADADIEKFGHYVFVEHSSIKTSSVATPKEVEEYIDNYENNPFKNIADDMLTKKQQAKALKKVRSAK